MREGVPQLLIPTEGPEPNSAPLEPQAEEAEPPTADEGDKKIADELRDGRPKKKDNSNVIKDVAKRLFKAEGPNPKNHNN